MFRRFVDIGTNLEAREALVFMYICLNVSSKTLVECFLINCWAAQEKAELVKNIWQFYIKVVL